MIVWLVWDYNIDGAELVEVCSTLEIADKVVENSGETSPYGVESWEVKDA